MTVFLAEGCENFISLAKEENLERGINVNNTLQKAYYNSVVLDLIHIEMKGRVKHTIAFVF